MEAAGIAAYDLPVRVAAYDADMDLMHPNRGKMVQVALEILPFDGSQPLNALDLGIGTGFFTKRFLDRFPSSHVTAVDGAQAMVELATVRLRSAAQRVSFILGDFRALPQLLSDRGLFDLAFSSFALHHLGQADKQAVLSAIIQLLKPGGWFVNADILAAESAVIEERIQELRCRGIVERAGGRDARFIDVASTRRFIAEMQEKEADQPLSLAEDLRLLRAAGLTNATVFWLEYRECVLGGCRDGGG